MQNAKWKMKNGNIVVIDRVTEKQQFTVGSSEEKTFVLLLLNHTDQKGELKIILEGERARVQILGIIIGSGKQQIRLKTIQLHSQPESQSDLLIKSVLFDASRLYYEGLIKIDKKAGQSNAYQKNQNLLLSPTAWADSRPSLEILNNDVRCTHGATIGTVDEMQLLYLSSRGISPTQAVQLIAEGFFTDVLNRIPDFDLAKTAGEKTYRRLTANMV